MAAFNPDTGADAAKLDYTGYSKGVKADTSAGNALENEAGLFSTVAKGIGGLVQDWVKYDTTRNIDAIQNQFTGDGPTPDASVDHTKKVPDDIVAKADRLQILTDKYRAGALDMSHYHTLLNVEARRLRSMYPGHREVVDNVISDLTGGLPANKIIADIAKNAAKKSGDDAQLNNELHWARENGTPEVVAMINAGKTPSLAEARRFNMNHGASIAGMKQEKQAIELKAARGGDILNDVMKSGQDQLYASVEQSYRGAMAASGSSTQALLGKAQELAAKQAKGEPFQPGEEEALRGMVQQFKQEQADQFNKIIMQGQIKVGNELTSYARILGVDKVEELRKGHTAYVDSIVNPIINKDYGLMGHNAAYIETVSNSNYAALLRNSETAQSIVSARKLLGDQSFGTIVSRNNGPLESVNKVAMDIMMGNLGKKTSLADDFSRIDAQNAATGGKIDLPTAKAKLVNTYAEAILDPAVSPQIKRDTIYKLFGDNSDRNFYASASPQGKQELYTRLINPRMADAIMKHGSPQEQKQYAAFVDAAAGDRMAQDARELKRLVVDTDSTAGVKWDPVTHTFQVTERSLSRRQDVAGLDASTDRQTVKATQNVVDRLNQVLVGYTSAMTKVRGAKPEDINYTLERNLKALADLDINNIKLDETKLKPKPRAVMPFMRAPVQDANQ